MAYGPQNLGRPWQQRPLRKPLALGAAGYVALIAGVYVVRGIDVPPGIGGLLEAMLYSCVGGYALSSGYEAVHRPWGGGYSNNNNYTGGNDHAYTGEPDGECEGPDHP